MKNRIDYSEYALYFSGNVNYKVEYLNKLRESGYKIGTIKVIIYLFKNAKVFEDEYGKDIYDFTQDELEIFLKSLGRPTIFAIQSSKASLDKYLLNSVFEKKSIFSVSPTLSIKRSSFNKFVFKDARRDRLCTEKELYNCMGMIENRIDAVLLLMIFRGMYNKNFEFIRNLKQEDVDFDNNKISIVDYSTGELTEFDFNSYDMGIIKQAMMEDSYLMNTIKGNIVDYDYVTSPYFFKVYKVANKVQDEDSMISQQSLRDKLRTIQKSTGNMFISSTTIAQSGSLVKFLNFYGLNYNYVYDDVREFLEANDIKHNFVNFKDNLDIMKIKMLDEL